MPPIYLITKADAMKLGTTSAVTYRTFDSKSAEIRTLINEAIYILDSFGIPVADKTPRQMERMAIAFLALCDVKKRDEWKKAKSLQDDYSLKTRDVIAFVNQHFNENMSRGSYDDIRRKDLKHPILAHLVVTALPNSARNNPNRAWAINPEYIELIRLYGTEQWAKQIDVFIQNRITLREQLLPIRNIPRIPIRLPSGVALTFGTGQHNVLQKAIIEDVLPRYGYGARVVYVGDAENKFLHYDKESADSIGLKALAHAELPDIIAYSSERNWVYLIEAVHTSGPISAERVIALKSLLKNCVADPIYLTAFLDRATFRKFVADIAWETEVWIASEPDHVIHFDGERFLGPYT